MSCTYISEHYLSVELYRDWKLENIDEETLQRINIYCVYFA